MKLKKVDPRKQSLKLKAENNRDLRFLLIALAAEKLTSDDWKGWIDVNGAKVRFNPKTRTFYYAAKVSDNQNKYLFDHLAKTLVTYTNAARSAVDIKEKFGKELDIYMGGETRYYCAIWKPTEDQCEDTANSYFGTPDHFRKLISKINAEINEHKNRK